MTNWTPPPPGDTREQLPPAILALLTTKPYTSTACDTAQRLEQAAPPKPTSGAAIPNVDWYVQMLHTRCRRNQKFTGQLCACTCHDQADQPGTEKTDTTPAATQLFTHICGQEPHTWSCVTTVETDTIRVDNPRNTGWYWTCTTCNASVGKYFTDDQARAQAAIDHPQCPPDPNGPYAWTIPTATEATDGWTQQDDGTWTLPVDEGTILFTRATTPEERARFATAWAQQRKTDPCEDCLAGVHGPNAHRKHLPSAPVAPADLREQYAAAVECAIGLNVDCGGTQGVHRVRDAVLAVRDREMERMKLLVAASESPGHAVRMAAQYADQAIENGQRAGQFAATLAEVLAHFTHETHPGQRCLQTGHVPVGTVDRWRAALNPPKEPTP